MIQENRKLWKLLLFTIPTFGIYNIYFWFRFTQDLNQMNQKEKRIKNYILVCFLSIITLGIYRWVWLFYIEDRLQMTGEDMGIKVHPGPGTTLILWTFGKFILIGPLLADFFIIHNMNKLAKAYNVSFSKNTKVLSKEDTLTSEKKTTKKAVPTDKTITKTTGTAAKSVAGNTTKTTTYTGSAKAATNTNTKRAADLAKTTIKPAGATGSSTKKTPENKPKVVNKQVITPEKKPSGNTQKTEGNVKSEAAATKETASKNKPKSGTVTLDTEKKRPHTSDATLTINPGLTNMPTGKDK
ncbi:MAG: DUF4234 domain-containing protein [Lachnospiraceae bacterium]|nr:DUF4234 domain-containing protein [Lachnospiraceae bacterium]